ncbi:MAG TPA: tetratricopeptide repeat protein, partial [Myxococcota bacterium]|nr:tetratricopeptide repeat protein [Myxococcota bacterium]
VQQALADLGDQGGELQARLLTVRAGIRYEVGDSASLEGALEDLTAATRLLQEAGDVQAAARLLNEQAAVWIRMGDPVRATWLLRESLQIYGQQRQADPRAAAEWAETQHLLARLPLHVQARDGQQDEALLRALDHASAAEGVWKQLGATRELARVWDTRGNLLLRQGKVHLAGESLRRAAQAQRSLGDVVGMAISMGGLAEVEAREGRPDVALVLLSDSIALNREKGSRVGLSYNRRALTRLEEELRPAPSFTAVVAELNQAEKEAGG